MVPRSQDEELPPVIPDEAREAAVEAMAQALRERFMDDNPDSTVELENFRIDAEAALEGLLLALPPETLAALIGMERWGRLGTLYAFTTEAGS